ncbi:hypothetical protein ILUMI_20243, partial [Ignelater luminosus]
YDHKENTFHFKIQFDPLPLVAFYEISGQIVRIPLEGKGIGRVAIGPINAVFEIKGDMRKFRGIDYYNPKNANVGLNIGDGSFDVEGLFDKNQQLGRMANEMLNSNSVMAVKAATPMLEKLCEIGAMRFMKTLMKIPYYKLFPPSRS